MTEAARSKVVYGVMETLLESQKRAVAAVWSLSQPLSGEEFEQVCEERALAGYCGSPMCLRQLPRRASGQRRKLSQITFCSSECEAAVQQLMRGLGGVEVAQERYLIAEQLRQRKLQQNAEATDMDIVMPPVPLDALRHEGFGPAGVISHGPRASKSHTKEEPAAARGGGMIVMSEIVQERQPAAIIRQLADDRDASLEVVDIQMDLDDPCEETHEAVVLPSLPQQPDLQMAAIDKEPSPQDSMFITNQHDSRNEPRRDQSSPDSPADVVAAASSTGNMHGAKSTKDGSKRHVSFAAADTVHEIERRQDSQAVSQTALEPKKSAAESQKDAIALAFATMDAARLLQQQQRRDAVIKKQQQRKWKTASNPDQQSQQQQQQPKFPAEGAVLVLDIDETQAGDGDELGQVFGQLQVQDASELVMDVNHSSPATTSPITQPAIPSSPPADETETATPSAFTDVVLERSPTATRPSQTSSTVTAGKPRPSRFLQRHVSAISDEQDSEKGSVLGDLISADRSSTDAISVVEGFGMDVARLTRKRRQDEEDAAAQSTAEQLRPSESLPAGSSPVTAAKARTGSSRGRPLRLPPGDEDDAPMPRLPGHLGSAVVQEAAALADMACVSTERAGKDGAAPGGDEHSRAAANDEGDRRRHRTGSDESSSDSDSDKDSDVSEQASYPEGYSHLMLDDSDDDSEGLMPLPYPDLSPFGKLYTLLDSWVSREALDFIEGKGPRQLARSEEERQRAAAFMRSVVACLPNILKELRISAVPRSALESAIQDLVSTLDFMDPISSLGKQQWDMVLLVALKSLSFAVVPKLQPTLESRDSVTLLSTALSDRGLTEDHFACLVEVLCPDD